MYCMQMCACRCSYTRTEGKEGHWVSFCFILYDLVLNLSVPHSLETKSFSDPEARLSTSKHHHHVSSLHSLGGYICNINTPGFYRGAKDPIPGPHTYAADTNPLSHLLRPDLLSS